jgi:hypothetical protein
MRRPAYSRLALALGLALAAGAVGGIVARRTVLAGADDATPYLRVVRDGPALPPTRTDIRYPFEAEITGRDIDDLVVVQWVRGRQCAPDLCFDTRGRWIVDNQTGGADGAAAGTLAEYPSLLGPWAERSPDAIRFRDTPGFAKGPGVPLLPGDYSLALDFRVNVYSRRALGTAAPTVERLRTPDDPPPLLTQPWTARGVWTLP